MTLNRNPKDYHVRKTPCPQCGAGLDGALGLTDDAGPKAGDITICLECRAVSVFSDAMSLREPTPDELKKLAGNRDLIAAFDILAAAKSDKP